MGTRLLSRFVEIWATVLIGQYSAPCKKNILASLSKTSRAFRRFFLVLALAGWQLLWQLLDTHRKAIQLLDTDRIATPAPAIDSRTSTSDFRTPIEAFILTQFLL